MAKKKTKRKPKTESLADGVNNRRIDLTPEQVETIITERGLVFIDPLSDVRTGRTAAGEEEGSSGHSLQNAER